MQMSLAAKEFLEDFVSLIFPRVCIHCEKVLIYQEEHICTNCRLSLPKTNYHLASLNMLTQKFAYEPKVILAAAYLHFHKRGVAQSIIHNLKYKANTEVGEMLGRWYGSELAERQWKLDAIIPVPLHRAKFVKRGFNQSEHFGIGLSEALEVPICTDWVIRSRITATQTKKSKLERWQNVNSIYTATQPDQIDGKYIMVVDDVLTTGATIGELVSLLVAHGAVGIYVITIAAGK